MPKLQADYPCHVNFQSSCDDKLAIQVLAKMKNFAGPSHLYRTIVATYIKQAKESMSPEELSVFNEAMGYKKIEKEISEVIDEQRND